MKNRLKPFFIAVQFLTRLPVSSVLIKLSTNSDNTYSDYNLARSLKYYPVLGLFVGGILVLTAFLLYSFSPKAPLYIAAVVSFVWLLLSGGLHLDGVADMADAWVGGIGDKTKTLEIMKDPCCGPFGVISIVLVLLMKFVLVFEITQMDPYLLLFAPFIARMAVVLLLVYTQSAKKNGMAVALAANSEKTTNILSISLFFLILIYLLSLVVMVEIILSILLVCGLYFILFRRAILRRVSGVTGDLAGAFIEYTEVLVLFTLLTSTMIAQSL